MSNLPNYNRRMDCDVCFHGGYCSKHDIDWGVVDPFGIEPKDTMKERLERLNVQKQRQMAIAKRKQKAKERAAKAALKKDTNRLLKKMEARL